MVSHIEQRVLSLISTWPTPDASGHERFAHTCTSHNCNGLGYLFVENPANFEIQYNMRALIRILASENCRIEFLEDPIEDAIYSAHVMSVSGIRVRQPMLTWIAHSHRPHGVVFNHARSIPHARSRVEAVVFVTGISNGISVTARRLTMPSEHALLNLVTSSPIPWHARLLYNLSDPRYGLARVLSEKITISLQFIVVLTATGDYRPRLNDAALWPFLLPLIAQEQMHSDTPVLEFVQHPTQTEQAAIRRATTDHVFCIFRHVGHPFLLLVTSEIGDPDNFSSGRRALRYVPLDHPLAQHLRLRAPLQILPPRPPYQTHGT